MVDIIIKISQLLLSLSILVVLHELGHFIPAKLFKTKVEKFYLFFDWPFSLFKKKVGKGETFLTQTRTHQSHAHFAFRPVDLKKLEIL